MMVRPLLLFFPLMCLAIGLMVQPLEAQTAESRVVDVQVNTTGDDVKITSTIVIRTNGSELRVVRNNGDVHVQLDGEDVPEDRLRREGNRLIVLDAEGSQLHAFRLLPGGGVNVEGDRPRRPMLPDRPVMRGGGGGGIFGQRDTDRPLRAQPRGYVGVTLSTIDYAIATQLNLDRNEVILIASVFEDGPADRAGLKAHDIVLKVDGQSPVTHQVVAGVVRSKRPGETVTFTVLRAGETHEIDVEIGAVADRMAGVAEGQEREAQQQLRRHAERLRERIRQFAPNVDFDAFRDELLRELEREFAFEFDEEMTQKLKELAERATDRAEEYLQRMREELDVDRIRRRFDTDRFDVQRFFEFESIPGVEFFRDNGRVRGMIFAPPDAPQPPRRMDGSMQRLEERMDALERQLSRIERLLEQLAEDH